MSLHARRAHSRQMFAGAGGRNEERPTMWYFSYGHDLNDRALAEWYDLNRLRAQPPRKMTAAVANNFRIAFPVFSSYWQGGVAGIVHEPGKRVAGALVDLPEKHYERLA